MSTVSATRMSACVEEDIRSVVARDLPWERFAGCTVAITGAGGFIGSYLVRTLLALERLGKVSRPVRVIAMVRDAERAQTRFADVIGLESLQLMRWDLTTIAVPELGETNYVIHAGSQASPRFYGVDPLGTLLPNTVGTAALLEALRRCDDPRGLLFVSSSEIYGTLASDGVVPETLCGTLDPAALRSCYAESKRAGEAMCVAWTRQHQLPTSIVRPFHTYGPGLTPEDGRVFADFAFNVLRRENIVMNSDGNARRAFCYASDAIAGFFTVMLCGEPALPYNVANGAGELSVLELAEMLVALFPDHGLRVERRFESAASAYLPSTLNRIIPDTSRLEALGWAALVEPATGFRRMIEAHEQSPPFAPSIEKATGR